MQKIIFIGNLGRDPEMRYTASGQAVTSFPVAVNEQYTTKSGERREVTTWFRVTSWGDQAEVHNQYLRKGLLVYVEGKMVADPETGGPHIWGEDEAKANFEVKASYVKFLSKVEEEEEDDNPYEERKPKPKPKVKAKAGGGKVKTGSGKQPWMED